MSAPVATVAFDVGGVAVPSLVPSSAERAASDATLPPPPLDDKDRNMNGSLSAGKDYIVAAVCRQSR